MNTQWFNISTDSIVAVGLVFALIVGMFHGADKDLCTTIAVGLVGYIGGRQVGGAKNDKS